MHTIDLSNYSIHTDLIIDELNNKQERFNIDKTIINKDIILEEFIVDKTNIKDINMKEGYYETITFKDISDKDNFKLVEDTLIEALKKMLNYLNISDNNSCLIVGLGNDKSTPDSLGPKVINNVLVTSHLFLLGEVEDGYRKTSSFIPNVTGNTGIETNKIINSLVKVVKPDFMIIIDALASSNISRLNKTIQLTSSGINPGSGIGNDREAINSSSLNIPVIAIGVPTVVDATTIVTDTLINLFKKISFNLDEDNNIKKKMIMDNNLDYSNYNDKLSLEQKKNLLGYIGTLKSQEIKELILEVLTPINSNLIVTPTEMDFLIEKISLLISNSINKSLHKNFNSTK